MYNPQDRRTEEVLASGGKDKQLKLWNINNLL
jgi:WD40 repeat protein